jgi:hypothetical protein
MDQPIACSLSATDLDERRRELAALRRDALLDRTAIPGGVRLAFADAPGTAGRLAAAIDAEAACCPFLTLALERDGDRLVLDVTGPADALPAIEDVFA